MFKEEIKEVEVEEAIDTSTEGLSYVILYNDDWHTFDEVIFQLMLATDCTQRKAEQEAYEVHTTGKSRVFDGQLEDCLSVSAILEDIALKTEIIH
jgi:ATP-dependent Clp protease adapter protein ClpS